ncbi:hypothetical protein EDB92DRAFT_1941676 [Lactarius akahatsu]|uniref:SUZ domain-containing protein n=1 Tax=Lactarius akahatsu TaxID=416441 RepID=A0AAD4QE34_9AGAM|nr:hypothetical protein EDB92DRAFT_1941676 [Lactarius akahatsu]
MSRVPSADTDPWDCPVGVNGELGATSARGGTSVPLRQPAPAPTRAVPDDWDDDPSSSDGEDSQKIWDDANKAGPMPELVLASSRTGSTPNVVPPASAFQSPVRILKRSLQKPTNVSQSASATTETFAERSARYNAARERIFADTSEGKVGGGEGGAASLVVRNPRGPGDSPGPIGRGREALQNESGVSAATPRLLSGRSELG